MGIGYDDSIILYNRYINDVLETETYFGTRFNNVRIELTQGANIRQSGLENADSCLVKIPDEDLNDADAHNLNSLKTLYDAKRFGLPKPYLSPKVWDGKTAEDMEAYFTIDTDESNFFVIIKKKRLRIDISDLPVGRIESDSYRGGFYQWVREEYGHAYMVHTLDTYDLIPRFEIGGR